jgi:hypothetical protein
VHHHLRAFLRRAHRYLGPEPGPGPGDQDGAADKPAGEVLCHARAPYQKKMRVR